MPKISIIIAVYNVEKYLKQCLDSVVNQTLKEIEVICINDGSTDKSLNILEEYASKDNRFVIIDQENQGPGIARNKAINVATGDYIMILDPDDWLELNACELAYNQISQNENDIVIFTSYKYYEKTKEKELYDYRIKPFKNHLDNPRIKFSDLENDFIRTPFTWAQIYSRKFINKNNIMYTHEKLGEDLYFWIKAITSSNSFSILDKPIHNYRIRENSAVRSYLNNWYDLFSTRYYCLDLVKDLPTNYINAYLIFVLDSLCWWYKEMSTDRTLNKEIYEEFQKFFIYVSNNYDLSAIKSFIKYTRIKRICSRPWNKMLLETILQNVFEITNIGQYKIITILGRKIKIKRKQKQKRVITYGTYDILHYGHINLLKRAKALGDYLIVALSSDEFNAVKNKKSYYTYEQRKMILESCKYVDMVIPEHNWDQKISDVQKYQADIFVMGDDWEGKFDFLKEHCEVVYLPRTPDVSSTQTKEYLTRNN